MTLPQLEANCSHCQRCNLHQGRRKLVFGAGNPQSKLLFIGEAPGQDEDATGLPFVGKAGMLLDDMLELIGLTRQDVYITNLVKCHPQKGREVLAVEQDACLPWLRSQAKILQPKLIVCFGRVTAQRIIDSEFKITKDHGKWFSRGDWELMAMYHPTALLHDTRKRPEAFDDLKSLQMKLRQHGILQ